MSAERRFKLVETDSFRASLARTTGLEHWEDRIKPDLEVILGRNPHRLPELGNGRHLIRLVTGHAIFYRVDFNHAEVLLDAVFGPG